MKDGKKRLARRGAVGGQRDQERIAANLIRRLAEVFERQQVDMEDIDRIAVRLEPLADEAVALLERMLASDDVHQQWQAVRVAAELCDDRLVEPLRRTLHDRHFPAWLRVLAVRALAQLAVLVDEATFFESVLGPIAVLSSGDAALHAGSDYFMLTLETLTWATLYEPGPLASYLRQQLVPRAERAMLPLLTALIYHPDDDVVMAAMEGLERIKEPALLPLLEERARYDPSAEVRQAAEKAALRLGARTAGQPPQPWLAPPVLPLLACYLRAMDGDGGQVLMVARGTPSTALTTVNYIYNDHDGLIHCVELTLAERDLIGFFEGAGDMGYVQVPLATARSEVERVLKCTLEAGQRPPPAFNLVRTWLDGDDPQQVEVLPLPALAPQDQPRLLGQSDRLLLLDEFDRWLFPQDMMEPHLPRYGRLERRGQLRPGHRLREMLIDRVVTDLVAEGSLYRRLLPERLRRQAWLLMQIYGENGAQMALSALAAAAGLEQGIVREHPLLRAMAVESLDQAWSREEEEEEFWWDELDDEDEDE